MTLPFEPPLDPMLAKLREDIPEGEGWLYEPKWDGFRAIVFRGPGRIEIMSRDRKPLNRYFPELVAKLETELSEGVVDGEVVVPGPRGLDFDSLQMRIHPAASRVEKLAGEIPAGFVAFDLLADGPTDLRSQPLGERRRMLEAFLGSAVRLPGADGTPDSDLPQRVTDALRPGPTLALTPQTDDASIAARWFDVFEGAGLDGLIAKRADSPYSPGQRTMLKIKHKRTADCVVGGYRLNKTKDGIGSLLLGLYDGGVLQYVGHTSSFKAPERRALLAQLRELEGHESFGGGRSPGGISRWTGASGRDPSWVPVRPDLVCEVSYDHLQGERFRHASTFVRWRPDKEPRDCTFDQILPEARRRS